MKKTSLALIVLLVCAMAAYAGDGTVQRRAHPFPSRYIVELSEPLPNTVDDLLSDIMASMPTAKAVYVWKHAIKGFALNMTDQQAIAVSRLPFVKQVSEDGEIELAAPVATRSWNIDRIDNLANPRLDSLYDACTTGWGVFVYVIDSGVWGGHDEFSNPDPGYPGMPRVRPGYDVLGTDGPANNPCQGYRQLPVQNGSHGTAVASIIAGRTMGVAREATIVPVRVFDCTTGKTNEGTVIAAIDWILQDPSYPNGAGRVVNMSFVESITNPPPNPTPYENSIHRLIDVGITVVVAAGNQNAAISSSTTAYLPARMPDVITVAASKGRNATDPDSRWDDGPSGLGSNYGPEVDIFAPGDHVLSAFWSGPTAVRDIQDNSVSSGTSFACALASGMAARWVTATGASPAIIHQYFVDNGTYAGLNILNRNGSPNLLTHIGNGCRRRP